MNIKLILLGLAVVSVLAGVKIWYDNQIEAAFNRGAQSVVEEYKAKVEETNKQNREFEKRMGSIITNYSTSISKAESKRTSAELRQLKKIEELIAQDTKYNTCEVDDLVIESRNNIRELGPKG